MFRELKHGCAALAALSVLGSSTTASAVDQTVGLFVNTPSAFQGYTLFGPRDWPVTYLIDMEGNLVHSWQHTVQTKNANYLLENGHLVRCARTENPVFDHRGSAGKLQEWNWDGDLLWEFDYSDDFVCGHHDIEPLPNGNLLVIAWELITPAEAIAAGRDPALLGPALWPDQVVEIQPVGTDGANIVWMWRAWDHLIQDFDATKANFGVVADHPELIDLNEARDDREDWMHCNGLGYDAGLDQIVISSNNFQEIWVIDHSTTTEEAAGHTGGARGKGGDLLYRWGKPANYGRGTEEDQRLFNNHNPQWIPPGRPGAGNVLVFNNGRSRWPDGSSYSTVEEIVTTADANGDYPAPPPGEAHGPADALWTYASDPTEDFFSSSFGGLQRQPNGNTLIIESTAGRVFELDASENIVWEYVIPVNGNGPIVQGTIPENNSTFRAPRFAPTFPAFAGRDLKPMGPIELDPTTAPELALPAPFSLGQNLPNPFHPVTTIAFSLRAPAHVGLRVHDVRGRHVATLLDGHLGAGQHRQTWGAKGLPSGVYFYTLRVGAETSTRQMILLR